MKKFPCGCQLEKNTIIHEFERTSKYFYYLCERHNTLEYIANIRNALMKHDVIIIRRGEVKSNEM